MEDVTHSGVVIEAQRDNNINNNKSFTLLKVDCVNLYVLSVAK